LSGEVPASGENVTRGVVILHLCNLQIYHVTATGVLRRELTRVED